MFRVEKSVLKCRLVGYKMHSDDQLLSLFFTSKQLNHHFNLQIIILYTSMIMDYHLYGAHSSRVISRFINCTGETTVNWL